MTSVPINVLLTISIDAIRMLFVIAVKSDLLKVLSQEWARTGLSAVFPR